MDKIVPKNVLFIKLGQSGVFEEACITVDQTLRLSYHELDHNMCLRGDWSGVHRWFVEKGYPESVATGHTTQVRYFYEADQHTLWLTFYGNRLWWCFSRPDITLLPDGTKTRPAITRWSDTSISGQPLSTDRLSGRLLKTQGFRGTICTVEESEYAKAKINGEELPEVAQATAALLLLQERLKALIKRLSWQDFETLIDLIFRQAGWQRVGATGRTQKTLDLDLLAPVTGETAIAQIKSESNLAEFIYYEHEFTMMTNCTKFFYVVHSPSPDLRNHVSQTRTMLIFEDKIAELTISSGLTDWVIRKS